MDNRASLRAHVALARTCARTRGAGMRIAAALACGLAAAVGSSARAQQPPPLSPIVDEAFGANLRRMAQAGADAAVGEGGDHPPRVQVEMGTLDPRLKLAPCNRIEPQLPANAQLLGRTRIGLRCVDGASRWQVWLPLTVRVYAPSVVATRALRIGDVLAAGDVAIGEADVAAEPGPAVTDATRLVGRRLVRDARPGDAVKDGHLKARTWFAAGEPVRVVANGDGWRIDVEAVALAPGVDGSTVRARTESGRTVSGRAVAPHLIEVPR